MNKRHWIVTIFSLVLLVALVIPACAQPAPTPTPTPTPAPTPAPTPPPAPKSVKFQYTMPPKSAIGFGFEWWAREFEKQTQNRYKVETYPLSGLIPDKGALDAIKGGVCEVIMTSTGSQTTTFRLASVTGLPTLAFHKKGVAKEEYLASFEAWREFVKLPEIAEEFKGLQLVQPFEIDPSYLVTRKTEVFVPEDLKGLKVGASAGNMTDFMAAFGAAAVFQIPPESYVNMDKGVTDAAFMTYAQIGPYKMYEIAGYVLRQVFSAGALLVLTNPTWYNSLPPADQKIFNDTWEAAKVMCAEGMYNENVSSKPIIEASKMKINNPSAAQSAAWVAAAEKYAWPRWAADAQKLGASAAATAKIIKAWQDLIAKYTTQK